MAGFKPRSTNVLKRLFSAAIAVFICASSSIYGRSQIVTPQKQEKGAVITHDVNLVLVPITVTDAVHRPVLDLSKEDFKVYEDKQAQKIEYFFHENEPISVGLVLDFSASMSDKADRLRKSIRSFFDYSNPEDEFYVVTVSTHPSAVATATRSIDEIEQNLSHVVPSGWTALLDGVDLVMRMMQNSRFQRRVVIMISDGGDNDSHLSLRRVRNLIEEQNADVFGIGIFDRQLFVFKPLEEKLGRHTMTRLTDASGGCTISVDNVEQVPEAIANISRLIRDQYVLGYLPKELHHDGSPRKIRVEVKSPSSVVKLRAIYRKSYSAK